MTKTLSDIQKENRDDFKRVYEAAYRNILPAEVLAAGNEWFEVQIDSFAEKAYAAGRIAGIEEALKALPEEIIIHEYMPHQNTEGNNAWNHYRNGAIQNIAALLTEQNHG